jgi:tetratricopeptide (TPR) repeat protein
MRRALGAAILLAGLAAPGAAEEWYDAYGAGLEALRHKQGAKAVEAFERAIKLRREPGVNVITYGTNKLDRYFPYLRLAETHLLRGDLESARAALKRSEAIGRESAVERAGIAMLLESASEKAVPPSPPSPLAAGPVSALDADLLAAIRQVEQGRYEAGIAALEAVAQRLRARGESPATSAQIAQAYLYLGIAYIGRSQEERLRAGSPRPPD